MSVRLSARLLGDVRALSRQSGRPISRVIRDLIDEALRTRRYPGVVFIDGPAGRRAHVAGTGLDVWEVVRLVREMGSAAHVIEAFPRLSTIAIHIAVAYATEYAEEIQALLDASDTTPEQLKRRVPWAEVSPA